MLQRIGREQDRGAFEELYLRVGGQAYALAFRITRCGQGAEDVVQEGLLRVWRYAHTFDPHSRARPWILKVVAREGARWIAKRRCQRAASGPATRTGPPSGLAGPATWPQDLPGLQLESSRLLARELQALRPELQQMLALRFGGGLSFRQIGQAMAHHPSAVKRDLQKALKILRTRLQGLRMAAPASLALSQEHLWKALGEGIRIPDSLRDLILGRLMNSLRDPTPSPLGLLGVARSASVCLLLAGLAWISARLVLTPATEAGTAWAAPVIQTAQPQPQPQPQAAAMPGPGTDPAGSPKTFQAQYWDFERPGAFTTEVWEGGPENLSRAYHPRTGTYGLVARNSQFLVLPAKIPSRPLSVTIRVYPFQGSTARETTFYHLGLGWIEGANEAPRARTWISRSKEAKWPYGTLRTYRFQVQDARILILINGHLAGASFYERPYPGERLMVQLRNLFIEDIALEPLDPHVAPQAHPFLEGRTPRGFAEILEKDNPLYGAWTAQTF